MKKLTIICKEDVKNSKGEVIQYAGTVSRTNAALAETLVMKGTHEYSTKGKLKSYLNKLLKLHKNHAIFGTAEASKPFRYEGSNTVYRTVKVYNKRGYPHDQLRVAQF
jgi:hypothetical protein